MTVARSLVLEQQHVLALRDIEVPSTLGPDDVRIRIHTVGICGSDIHYYTHGHIGPFVVREPMVLGHEASGVISDVGSNVRNLVVGDRVCMEPGIPDPNSRAAKLGLYNVDPAVRFWATPPVHGCLTEFVVHPAAYTYKLPDNVSFAEGAMIEPFAIGVQAAVKGAIKPGDTCVVTGCGTIGLMVALAALGSGAGRVVISDVVDPKLEIAARYPGLIPVNVSREPLRGVVDRLCGPDWGADVVLEASGSPRVYDDVLACVRPGGTVVLVGMPPDKVAFDIVSAQAKEIRIETVFRYANVFDRAIGMIASGRVDLKPLIAETFAFEQSVTAFERAASARPTDIKLQIAMPS
ncbi:NAD(P)-dependent alcohol dehydrogenase [Lichenicola cladoniae]|uniref:NAD(P)-dependent alcohol dehydrogenase n=1 Tax=Lichenicola cladoniae TaxID=1484109 RepID=A0A6M8HTA8_9PROT|nr:NAD(P)-dependent alcohol dehydrogenase [Lichenicola cladoniae]NPD67603.1 NAD(P)-dependent alcohol dehydrogenase [Acetobacteraceae bacterium]QKE91754.1 NAD(P)-dependent alcohol dehydrogenase [Lichenicola cladoniae]